MLSHLHQHSDEMTAPQTQGFVWNWARRYDLLLGVVTLGREQAFRRRIVNLAQVQAGERVLDVGCGTGTLAMVARRRVGASGSVCGIDPSPQMIARARQKAAHRNLEVDFQVGVIEQLPFPDRSFDVVLSTFMMHHLPDELKRRGLKEIARVLKPGGRLLVVDMNGAVGPWKSNIRDQPSLLQEAGFASVESGRARLSVFAAPGYALGQLGG
jgi:ubiquinone/menaquinone biosynthesis C-methylase UbiE